MSVLVYVATVTDTGNTPRETQRPNMLYTISTLTLHHLTSPSALTQLHHERGFATFLKAIAASNHGGRQRLYTRGIRRYYVRLRPLSPPPGWVGLLRTSRQIHSETANLPLPLNSFHISSPEHLKCLSHTLARSRISITKLRLDVKPRFELWRDRFLLPKILPHLKLLEVTFCSHRKPRLVNVEFLEVLFNQKTRKWFEDGCKGLLELVVLSGDDTAYHTKRQKNHDEYHDTFHQGYIPIYLSPPLPTTAHSTHSAPPHSPHPPYT
ncbi:hypothetical protein SNOG_04724 [Parastagonospora nodorum SN15]|uniref:Uncharacterized protein n=1 Tax=Phaeosphaeria nodorum (strain SN15 / ATCC MYA-4574 / FGSC 10173) TaxID=321614 RepID=Q0UU40_PHANO|nr:hypothetical protein SNOG_04724 [Parastagonospora nodorum SN15]EAT88484.1 hypothetical protein SNOG_04724 [Parastagonospora nodorum SN15]